MNPWRVIPNWSIRTLIVMDGFFRLKLRDVEELSSLMDSESYSELCDNGDH